MGCCSDVTSAEIKGSFPGPADGTPSFVQPVSGYQSAWVGVPGQVSMADIVRMGRPQSKASIAPNASHYQDPSDHQSEDEWPSIEKPAAANVRSVPEYAFDTELHQEDSNHHHYEEEQVLEREEDNIESSGGNDLGSVSISSRKILEDDSGGALLYESELYQNMGAYHSEAPDFEHHEGNKIRYLLFKEIKHFLCCMCVVYSVIILVLRKIVFLAQ